MLYRCGLPRSPTIPARMNRFRAMKFAERPRPLLLIAMGCVLPLAGCAVGPNFKKPAAPDASGYTAQPLQATSATAQVAGGESQRFDVGADLSGDWWTLFHSRRLNALIGEALANNHDLKAAQAALTVAHENTLAQRGAYYPSIDAGLSASRQHDPGAALAPVPSNNAFLYNLFTPQIGRA